MAHGGLDAVLGSLAELGLDAEWDVFSAGACRAGHRRARLFVLAWLLDGEREARRNDAHGLDAGVGNAWGKRLQGLESTGPTPGATRRAGIPPFPPGPADADTWRAVLERWPELAPAQPELRGLANGLAPRVERFRVERLRTAGNGVVPLVAARALVTLARRAGLK